MQPEVLRKPPSSPDNAVCQHSNSMVVWKVMNVSVAIENHKWCESSKHTHTHKEWEIIEQLLHKKGKREEYWCKFRINKISNTFLFHFTYSDVWHLLSCFQLTILITYPGIDTSHFRVRTNFTLQAIHVTLLSINFSYSATKSNAIFTADCHTRSIDVSSYQKVIPCFRITLLTLRRSNRNGFS